ncbi:hypothetical protein [Rhizobium sp. HT1-10]|uniref:hypothetical protein n=1 Tax=Rhizobium sp. HT1-10 TaxID=3111638 RepID=UPI003C1343CE
MINKGKDEAGRVLARAAPECLRRGNVPIAIGDQGARLAERDIRVDQPFTREMRLPPGRQ